MGNKQEQGDVQAKIKAERTRDYQEAWKLTSMMMQWIRERPTPADGHWRHVIMYTHYWYPWIMILGKLIRAYYSPLKVDHWRDMIGYAQLVIENLEEVDAHQTSSSDSGPHVPSDDLSNRWDFGRGGDEASADDSA